MAADRKLLVGETGKLKLSASGKLADKNCCCFHPNPIIQFQQIWIEGGSCYTVAPIADYFTGPPDGHFTDPPTVDYTWPTVQAWATEEYEAWLCGPGSYYTHIDGCHHSFRDWYYEDVYYGWNDDYTAVHYICTSAIGQTQSPGMSFARYSPADRAAYPEEGGYYQPLCSEGRTDLSWTDCNYDDPESPNYLVAGWACATILYSLSNELTASAVKDAGDALVGDYFLPHDAPTSEHGGYFNDWIGSPPAIVETDPQYASSGAVTTPDGRVYEFGNFFGRGTQYFSSEVMAGSMPSIGDGGGQYLRADIIWRLLLPPVNYIKLWLRFRGSVYVMTDDGGTGVDCRYYTTSGSCSFTDMVVEINPRAAGTLIPGSGSAVWIDGSPDWYALPIHFMPGIFNEAHDVILVKASLDRNVEPPGPEQFTYGYTIGC